MERRWQVVIEPYPGNGSGREIARVKHRDIGRVGGRIVYEREPGQDSVLLPVGVRKRLGAPCTVVGWAQFKVPKLKASKAPVPMHPVLAGFLMAWRERAPYAKDGDFVFSSFRLKGKKPLSASIMVQKYLRPAAVKAGVIKEDQRVRFGFHNFRHSLASSLVKLKCDPKTVQGILRHEDVRTTMQLYAQSDQDSRLEAQGKLLALLPGDKTHLLMETVQ